MFDKFDLNEVNIFHIKMCKHNFMWLMFQSKSNIIQIM